MLYTLNLYSAECQLYHKKTKRKKQFQVLFKKIKYKGKKEKGENLEIVTNHNTLFGLWFKQNANQNHFSQHLC